MGVCQWGVDRGSIYSINHDSDRGEGESVMMGV